MSVAESSQKLKAGSRAPDFNLMGVDGKFHSLDEFGQGRALVIIFMCNHCPYVISKLGTMKKLYETYHIKEVEFVAINSNSNSEYPEDSYENMKKFAQENGLKFNYLFDDSQDVAKQYGAECTPDPFVFDADLRLVYHGRFDDATSPELTPATRDMNDALDAVLVGSLPKGKFLPSRGCSIKWKD